MTSMTQEGMLFVAPEVGAADEADLDDRYDHGHVEERAHIDGFVSAARYRSVRGGRRHLGLYRTQSLKAFTSPACRAAFGKQTARSATNLGRMVDPMRRVCAVTPGIGLGQGGGSWLSDATKPRWPKRCAALPASADGAACHALKWKLFAVPEPIPSPERS